MKFLIFILLTSCGALQRDYTYYTGNLTYKCSKSGVEYVQADSGLTLHVDLEGKPIACGSAKVQKCGDAEIKHSHNLLAEVKNE